MPKPAREVIGQTGHASSSVSIVATEQFVTGVSGHATVTFWRVMRDRYMVGMAELSPNGSS